MKRVKNLNSSSGRGLSFILKASRQEFVRSNTGDATRFLLYDTPTSTGRPLAVEWREPWAFQVPLNVGAIGNIASTTDRNILANSFQFQALDTYNSAVGADGAPVQELREWRANAVVNFEFQEGRLKGFGVGGAVRWLDEAAIGFPVASFRADLTPVPPGAPAQPGDLRISDVRKPYYAPAETRFDFWFSYQRRVFDDKADCRLQLNIRNLFVQDELIPTFKNPDGSVGIWSIAEGQRIQITTSLTF